MTTEKGESGKERWLGVLVDVIRAEDVVKELNATVCVEDDCITAGRCQYAYRHQASCTNENDSEVATAGISTYMLFRSTTLSMPL